jgi:site-specific recombinase XerD
MKKLKDPAMFESMRRFLCEHLPVHVNASRHTIRSYRESLMQFMDFVAESGGENIAEVSMADFSQNNVLAFLDNREKAHGCSAGTRNLRLAGIRAFVAYAASRDIACASIAGALANIPAKKDSNQGCLRHLTESAVSSLLCSPDQKTAKGLRDAALLSFMYDSAARVQEVADITIADISTAGNPFAILRGKGRKVRRVPLMGNTARLVAQHVRVNHGAGANPRDALFFVVRGGERKKMTEDNMRKLIRTYADKARLSNPEIPAGMHPHLLRHSRAMHLYQRGMSLELVSQWLGHSKIETTLVYAHADSEMKRKAIVEATPEGSPLGKLIVPRRMQVSDDTVVRRLFGLE